MKLYAEVDDKDRKLKTLYGIVEYMDGTRLVCDKFYAVKEQEPLLDKIRAEIEQLRNFKAENYDLEEYCDYFDARIIFRDDVLQIIDKYRGEEDETDN